MIKELDSVVLKRDLSDHGLEQGDVGAVVHRYSTGETLEVEFVTGEGETVAVLTLDAEEVRPMRSKEVLHARDLGQV
ncbi:DUF4926 domain-containing protein [soil metagenome]